MDNQKNYIAFFDLDKTILSINSGHLLVREAYKNGLMNNADLLYAVYLSWLYKFNLRDTSRIISGMGKWLKGLTVAEVTELCERVVFKHLIGNIRPEIYSEIKFHKDHNAEIVILSSAIVEICRPIASHIGADSSVCTVMEIVDGVLTGFPEKKFCFDDEKRVRLLEYCEVRNYTLAEAFYYGDSISDFPALAVVGHPVCVAPDRKLSAISRKKGWRICDW
jgi:HAD superfamily hydrolase (TIGR01490 family)